LASKQKKSHQKKGKKEFMIGGQAVMEGVMMRTKNEYSVAVRSSKGKIVVKREKFNSLTSKNKLLNLPLIRGMIMLYETTVLGIKALNYSVAVVEDDDAPKAKKEEESGWVKAGIALTFLISAAFAIGLFKFLPLLSATLFQNQFGGGNFTFNLIDGITKLVVLLGYLMLIGLMPDVKRLFQYHGAEHMAVACYEKGMPLTVQNVRKCKKEHPRCGTSFIIFVLVLSILFYMVIPMNTGFWEKLGLRLLLLPLIAGVSYELIRIAGKYDNWATHVLAYPGVIVQKITTRKPANNQKEVAIKSLTEVLK
jgi:uncharacterized protein YqhQ